MNHERILLLFEHRENRHLLATWLAASYVAVEGDSAEALNQPFDLCIVDGVMLGRLLDAIRARKQSEHEVLLPVLLAFSRHEVGSGLRRIWEVVDEFISVPIEKSELAARVEMLLRARRFSRQNFELRRALETELAHAAQVQAALLPQGSPSLEGFELAAGCLPAREVGGDFYDWEEISPGILSFTLGDVCGKGMSAALLTATIRATLRAVSRQNGPAEALRLAHHALADDFERSGRFVTLFHGRLEVAKRQLLYADAGHGLVFLRRAEGRIEALQPGGMPLGAFADQEYPENTLDLRSGDTLLIFSDGLTESHQDEIAQPSVLAERLDQTRSATEMVERLLEIPRRMATLADDVTVMVLRCCDDHLADRRTASSPSP
ncbi:MAG: serine/threonine protein phosphatase [Betaproteobacteria bacterium]|nr:MAG: serine/threonine protein phosphatase [Betaproteobacteria bacterium]